MSGPVLKRKPTRPAGAGAAWRWRVLLAGCLLVSTEVIWWTEVSRPAGLWALAVLVYVALAALLLDVMQRYRAYDLFGGLLAAGVYGLLVSLLVHPTTTLGNLPITLVTRVMGAQTLAGGLALALFFVFWGRVGRVFLWGVPLLAGLFWGAWVRGVPLLLDVPPASFMWLAVAGGASFVLLVALRGVAAGAAPVARAFQLSLGEAGGVLGVLGVALAVQSWRGVFPPDALTYGLPLLFFCGVTLWFQKRDTQTTLLEAERHPAPLPVQAGALALLLVGASLTYQFAPPPGPETGWLRLITLLFGAFGLAWLPAVCVVLGVRAYRYSSRTGGKSL